MNPVLTPLTEVDVIPVLDRGGWASRLRAQADEAVLGIVRLGQELNIAKEQLGKDFYPMIETDMGRSRRWAQVLISIARHPAISEAKHVSQLPADIQSLYQLSRVDPDVVGEWIEEGTVTPTTSRRDVIKATGLHKEGENHARRVAERTTDQIWTVTHLYKSPRDWLVQLADRARYTARPTPRFLPERIPRGPSRPAANQEGDTVRALPKQVADDPALMEGIERARTVQAELIEEVRRRERDLHDWIVTEFDKLANLVESIADHASDDPGIHFGDTYLLGRHDGDHDGGTDCERCGPIWQWVPRA